MKATAQQVNPEDFILSVLSPEDRLDAAFKLAGEAFKGANKLPPTLSVVFWETTTPDNVIRCCPSIISSVLL